MNKMTIVLVGGGSGGHITPLIPVAEELIKKDQSIKVFHIGHKKDPLNQMTVDTPVITQTYEVSAGKFRRYNGEKWYVKLLDVKTLFFNVRDLFRFVRGVVEAWVLLGRIHPQAIFMKGGYVCAPVGIAARLRHIPYMTHDSDAMVSLAHRIIAKHALLHATAMPPQYYSVFEKEKIIQTGIPIRSEFQYVSKKDTKHAKKKLGVPEHAKVILVTGGGLGAQKINQAMIAASDSLLKDASIWIFHMSGRNLYQETLSGYQAKLQSSTMMSRVVVEAFSDMIHVYSAAADVVVTRAGATNIAEYAAQAKACIVVPNPLLTGGHQLKNAQVLIDADAAIIVQETQLHTIANVITDVIDDSDKKDKLGQNLHKTSQPGSATKIATLLVSIARKETV